MFRMVTHHLRRHKYKIAVGLPVVVLLASSLSLIRSPYDVSIVPEDSRYVAVDELVTLHVMVNTKEAINVVSGTIQLPTDYVLVETVSGEGSIIDLWAEEPSVSETGSVRFAGGIVAPEGFTGTGLLFALKVRPQKVGEAGVTWTDARILAHDGQGTELQRTVSPMLLSIRASEQPSPDVNSDARVNVFDFGIVSSRLFLAYEAQYDLNQDGKITLADLAIIISNTTDESRLGGLVLRW